MRGKEEGGEKGDRRRVADPEYRKGWKGGREMMERKTKRRQTEDTE